MLDSLEKNICSIVVTHELTPANFLSYSLALKAKYERDVKPLSQRQKKNGLQYAKNALREAPRYKSYLTTTLRVAHKASG